MSSVRPAMPKIPQSLAALRRWLVWRQTRIAGGARMTRRPDRSTISGEFLTLPEALAVLGEEPSNSAGVGLVMTGGVQVDGGWLVAFDLDSCIKDGKPTPWARELCGDLGSYVERSPSGRGLRVLGIVPDKPPALRVVRMGEALEGDAHAQAEVQVFGAGAPSYVTLTGDSVGGELASIRSGFDRFVEAHPETVMPPDSGVPATPAVGRRPTVDELEKVVRSRARPRELGLIDQGDWEGLRVPSASEGWFGLCRLVLAACAGHLDVAVDYLIERTAFGRQEVESKDPSRYASPDWVMSDLRRLDEKRAAEAGETFQAVALAEGATPASAGQQSVFDRMLPEVEPWEAQTPAPRSAEDVFGTPAGPAVNGTDAAQAKPVPEKPGFFALPPELLDHDRPPSWLVNDLFELDSLVVLSGAPASFKSFLVLDVAMSVAVGLPWQGRRTAHGPVVVLAGEGQGGIRRRVKAWAVAQDMERELRSAPLAISRSAAGVLDDEAFKKLERDVHDLALAWGAAPRMIVVDTLNRNFGGGDENSSEDVTKFLARIERFRLRYGCTVVLVHHVGHGDATRSRGSSVLGGTADAEVVMNRNRDKKTKQPLAGSQVTFRKMKDAEEPEPFQVLTEFVELGTDEENEPFGSLVIDRIIDRQSKAPDDELKDPAFQAVIDVALKLYGDEARASRARLSEVAKVSRRVAERARMAAINFGLLEVDGPTTARTYKLTATGRERLRNSELDVTTEDEVSVDDLLA